jgi:sulfite reductase alpha subunit-like flavoprotein
MVGPARASPPSAPSPASRKDRRNGPQLALLRPPARRRRLLLPRELRAWEKSGHLAHLSLAWSRDGGEKRYVQHLLGENRDELWNWFEAGATICICGSRIMAREVEGALARIAAEKGACEGTPESATAWLKARRSEKRVQVDAY